MADNTACGSKEGPVTDICVENVACLGLAQNEALDFIVATTCHGVEKISSLLLLGPVFGDAGPACPSIQADRNLVSLAMEQHKRRGACCVPRNGLNLVFGGPTYRPWPIMQADRNLVPLAMKQPQK